MTGVEERTDQADQTSNPTSTEVSSTAPIYPQDISFIEVYVKELAKKIAEDTVKDNLPRFTEILGVFVALFTFVSVNIQIFTRITSFNNALVFVILEFLCLAGFVIIIDLVINRGERRLFTIIVIIVAFLIPVFLFWLPNAPLSIEEKSKTSELEQKINILEKRFDDQIIRRSR